MHFLLRVPLLLLVTTLARAATLTLKSPRLAVLSSNGNELRSETLPLTKKVSEPVTLSKTDTLRLTFQIVEKDDQSKTVQPHQTFLRFFDEKTGEEGIQPVRVTASGKGKFELSVSKPPSSIPPTTAESPLNVVLIIGSASHQPLTIPLFDLFLPASHPAPVHPDEPFFHSLPEIKHTFRPDQKLPPRPISALFSAVVVAPWVVLIGLWSSIGPKTPRLFSPSILPFTFTLGAFEALLLWYWVDLKLGDVLFYGAGLGVVTIFTGKHALASIGARRLAGGVQK